ncbi:cytochrome P450 [Russula earlei]|uniref:Cytochrome P450 n=1 Tax=Russula earlei TaxID=71964 RepID=A0ACC0TZN4_9AGAM|nr:cytochrome P450 [Russula earlei]
MALINLVDCLAVSSFLYLFVAFCDNGRRGGHSYPPGPPPWPIVGNLLDVPKEAPWAAYANMSKKYGDVICLRVLGQVVVVLCSLSAVKELLEKRGETYADRPALPILECALLSPFGWLLPTSRKNETWREGRKLLDRSLRPGATISYRQMMQENTHRFLAQLLATPRDFRGHIEAGKFVMSLTYGYDLKDGDTMISAPVQAVEILSRLILPGAALVNHLPFLRHVPSWVPFLSYKPLARIGKELSDKMKNEPIDFVKNAMRDGTAVQSMASEHLREVENLPSSMRHRHEEIIKVAMGSIFSGTVSSMSSFFLALVLFPRVQRRAQEELDVAIGRDRLPTFDDRKRLPYLEAFCKELLRWRMVTPLAVPHASIENDVYKDFFIPKGATIVANAWAILHDSETYPDPEDFKPERFLDKDGSFRDDPALGLVFGCGKRICPGRHFVDATLFIVISSVLSVFNVTKAKDKSGHDIPVNAAMTVHSGIVVHPEKFECSIAPRDYIAEDLILANSLS